MSDELPRIVACHLPSKAACDFQVRAAGCSGLWYVPDLNATHPHATKGHISLPVTVCNPGPALTP